MFSFITQLINMVYELLSLPFRLVYKLLYIIYNMIFLIQIYLFSSCQGIFGTGSGCDIINPSYVFTTVIWVVVKYSIIIYVCIKLYDLWKSKNSTK
jgi:hypothetical protein